MTQQGDSFAFPDGTLFLVEEAPSDRPDGAVVFNNTVPATVFSPPPHRHPHATDSYEVLEGSFSIQVDGQWRTLKQGERADVPPGTVHTLDNRSGADAIVRNTHSPASGFDEFVAHADRLMRARKITKAKDIRVPILFSMLTLEYPSTLIPGRRRDTITTRVFASLGRALRMSTSVA